MGPVRNPPVAMIPITLMPSRGGGCAKSWRSSILTTDLSIVTKITHYGSPLIPTLQVRNVSKALIATASGDCASSSFRNVRQLVSHPEAL